MNVIGSRPDGWWRDRRAAQQRLARELEALDEPVTVVFDGKPHDTGVSGVEVRFAPVADDEIARLAGRGDRVVTSDAELARRVSAAGAEVEGAGAFRRRLDDHG
jgi:uncharacterized protein YaiI (UPF0178 family)